MLGIIFDLPPDPLALVNGHWLLNRLEIADQVSCLDPAKIKKIFAATTTEWMFVYNSMRRHPFQTKAVKVVAAYEKAVADLKKVADVYPIIQQDIDYLTSHKKFVARAFYLTPLPLKPEFFSINKTVSQQAYLLFELMKPLVVALNEGQRDIKDSNIHGFIADLLAAVYREYLKVHLLTATEIKNMIKNIRRTTPPKKLAALHRIIA